eukprot:936675-Pelagomonas_calceolata.AAC.2
MVQQGLWQSRETRHARMTTNLLPLGEPLKAITLLTVRSWGQVLPVTLLGEILHTYLLHQTVWYPD